MYEQDILQDRSRPNYQKVEVHGKDTHRSNDQDVKISKSERKELEQELC